MKDSTKRTLRTFVQAVVSIAVMLPGILQAPGVADALPWLAGIAPTAAAAARIMSAPAVQRWLPRWLRLDTPDAEAEQAAHARQ